MLDFTKNVNQERSVSVFHLPKKIKKYILSLSVLTSAGVTNLSAALEPLLHVGSREDLIIVDLVSTTHHGMQWLLAMLPQYIPPQHKLHTHAPVGFP